MSLIEVSETASEVVELVKKLVSFKSTIDNPDEITACADFIAEYFADYDVHVKRFVHNNIPSIFISLHDTKTPKVILNSHFDVVPAEDSMFETRVVENLLIGRGVFDDKGPLAILMFLIKELSKLSDKPDIALLTNGDEEVGGMDSIPKILENEAIRSDFALVLDGGGLNKYVTKAKGILRMKITARGQGGHGSRPWEEENPIEQLTYFFKEIKKIFTNSKPNSWDKTINLGVLRGGDAVNKVPNYAEMMIDIRYTDKDNVSEIIGKIREIVGNNECFAVEVIGNSPVYLSDENNPYIKKLLTSSKTIMNEEPAISFDHGGSDARFFQDAGIPSVVTWPAGGNHHSNEEFLDIEKVDLTYAILKDFLMKIK